MSLIPLQGGRGYDSHEKQIEKTGISFPKFGKYSTTELIRQEKMIEKNQQSSDSSLFDTYKPFLKSLNEEIGDNAKFWSQDFKFGYNGISDDGDDEIDEPDESMFLFDATLRAKGNKSVIYVEDVSYLTYISDSAIADVLNKFENVVYPVEKDYFGEPSDIDGDGRIVILLLDIRDKKYYDNSITSYSAGYFDYINQYNNVSDPTDWRYYSNHREIIYLDVQPGNPDDGDTLAHEYQHLIHFSLDKEEEVWVDEGLSMLSELLTGFGPGPAYISKLEERPYISLTYWDGRDPFANYGAAYLFMLYISERWGVTLISQIARNTYQGSKGISLAFQLAGYEDVTFETIFDDWTVANYLDGRGGLGQYSYGNITINIPNTVSESSYQVARVRRSIPYWSVDYLEFSSWGEENFSLFFDGEIGGTFSLGIILRNTSKFPAGYKVEEVPIYPGNIANWTLTKSGLITDKIILVIRSHSGTEGEYPVGTTKYEYMANPSALLVSKGNLSVDEASQKLTISNITVMDSNGNEWTSALISSFVILTSEGVDAGISGNLTYNHSENWWEIRNLEVGLLPAGTYYTRMYFANETSSVISYSENFIVTEPGTSNSTTNTIGNQTGSIDPTFPKPFGIPGFQNATLTLTIIILVFQRKYGRKKEKEALI